MEFDVAAVAQILSFGSASRHDEKQALGLGDIKLHLAFNHAGDGEVKPQFQNDSLCHGTE